MAVKPLIKYEILLVPTDDPSRICMRTHNLRGEYVSHHDRKLEISFNDTYIRNTHLVSSGNAATNVKSKYDFFELSFRNVQTGEELARYNGYNNVHNNKIVGNFAAEYVEMYNGPHRLYYCHIHFSDDCRLTSISKIPISILSEETAKETASRLSGLKSDFDRHEEEHYNSHKVGVYDTLIKAASEFNTHAFNYMKSNNLKCYE